MRLIPSDPDTETIVGRIRDSSLDLQPEFQRGAVWSRPKQRLLVDSILRGWYVPPVHVVRTESDTQVVLDGQQRLNSIFEFVQGRFTVDGEAEPLSEPIRSLGGLHYDELPERVRRRFDRFTVRMFEVVDYSAEEPFELFYRLNQPTPLTSAEKRNAFFGVPRQQIHELTLLAESSGMTADRLGFTNARLAYEDVIARFLWTVEAKSLDEKVTASRVTERYRLEQPFSEDIIDIATRAVLRLFSLGSLAQPDLRFNKAMLHSWLVFVARAEMRGESLNALETYIPEVEIGRSSVKSSGGPSAEDDASTGIGVGFAILNDRATARVNDVSSVLLRDAILWALYCDWHGCSVEEAREFSSVLQTKSNEREAGSLLLTIATRASWGRLR